MKTGAVSGIRNFDSGLFFKQRNRIVFVSGLEILKTQNGSGVAQSQTEEHRVVRVFVPVERKQFAETCNVFRMNRIQCDMIVKEDASAFVNLFDRLFSAFHKLFFIAAEFAFRQEIDSVVSAPVDAETAVKRKFFPFEHFCHRIHAAVNMGSGRADFAVHGKIGTVAVAVVFHQLNGPHVVALMTRILDGAFRLFAPELKVDSFVRQQERHVEPGAVHVRVFVPDARFPFFRQFGKFGQKIALNFKNADF